MPDHEEDEIILPWEAVKSPHTKEDYKRDARWFLEFAGFADPCVLATVLVVIGTSH